MIRPIAAAAAALIALAGAAHAGDITVKDVYARTANQKTGGAFMVIENAGDADDTLVEARSDVSRKVELHTHVMEDGVAKMRQVEGGIPVPAHGEALLQRGGYHVMFMGIEKPFEQGAHFPLTLVFEKAGEVTVDAVVDNERKPEHGKMKQSN